MAGREARSLYSGNCQTLTQMMARVSVGHQVAVVKLKMNGGSLVSSRHNLGQLWYQAQTCH
jgi:hypothetical protein